MYIAYSPDQIEELRCTVAIDPLVEESCHSFCSWESCTYFTFQPKRTLILFFFITMKGLSFLVRNIVLDTTAFAMNELRIHFSLWHVMTVATGSYTKNVAIFTFVRLV